MIFRIKTFLNFLIATVFNLVPYKSILFNSYRAYSIEEKLKLRIPYTNLQLINFFKDFSNENKNITIFEYGSGSSTLFFEDYFTNIYSVEHDENWFKVISKYIKIFNKSIIVNIKTLYAACIFTINYFKIC